MRICTCTITRNNKTYQDDIDFCSMHLAANDMYEALRDLIALYSSTDGHDPSFVKKGMTAIRKAEGK